ncbi:MAG TPA: amino acid adenylation domain-containing protein, partial [Herpetosiphonaceae bacterium]
LGEWATAPAPFADRRPVHELIDEQAGLTPDAIAVATAEASLTYAELTGRANQLARHLRALGIGRGAFAAIACENSAESVVGLLGVLKSGAAYVPLDVTAPPARLQFMLADTGAAAVLTKAAWHERFADYAGPVLCLDRDWPAIASQPAGPVCGGAGPDDLAYVIYTSGSTGQPKGVMVPHAGLANFARASGQIHRFAPPARVLGMPPLSFDAAGEAIFPPLLRGAGVVLHPAPGTLSAPALIDFCAALGVTAIVSSTALWNHWCNELLELDPDPGVLGVTQLILGGDSPSAASVMAWLELFPQTELFANHYGPTETTICATHCIATEALLRARDLGPLPIGGPLPNVEVYVLDAGLQPAPAGAPGQIYIGGAGLARGYLGQPALTAQRFVPHPFAARPGERLYATGDLARVRNDGALEFLGRADDQLKVRGYRIEPGEIEAALRQHPQVSDACLLPQTAAGDTRLIAYVASSAAEPLAPQLRDWLRSRLPDYMVPAGFVQLEALPLTSNGKVNRRLLPPYAGAPAETPFMLPRNTIEETLARIWAEVLELPSVGVDQNFFDLGGHSLLALRLVQRVQEAYPIKIPVGRLFEAATVAEFARVVVSALNGQPLETPIDLLAEAALGPEISPPDAGPPPGSPPRAALLTGATGFLGAYLLVELLAQTDAAVHCLVRADSPEAARERIMQNLARYGLAERAEPARIIPL